MQVIDQPISPAIRLRLLVQTVFTFITLLLAAALVIILSLQSFTGMASSAPLVLGTCTVTYYSNKYNKINNMLTINFFMSIVSLILQIITCILVFPPLISRIQPNQKRMTFIYVMVSLHMLAIINCFGKFSTFRKELQSINAGANCSVSYSEVLINVVLAISAADLCFSLLQFITTVVTSVSINLELEKEDEYKVVNNMTNNTVESIEEHNKFGQGLRGNFQQIPTQTISEKKLDYVKNEGQRYQSNVELVNRIHESRTLKNDRELILDKKDSFPIKPSMDRKNSISEEESLHSMMRQEKLALGKYANRPGPIISSSVVQENEKAQRSQGYLSYIRRMNGQQGQSGDTEGDLIAVIRGKYAK